MNTYGIYVFIEGLRDVRYFDKVLKPIFSNKYSFAIPVEYAQKCKKKLDGLTHSIKSMCYDQVSYNVESVCLGDMDNSPCISLKKAKIVEDKLNDYPEKQIFIVNREIEGWYLAGCDERCCKKLGIPYIFYTDNINKEQFELMLVKTRCNTPLQAEIEILNNYDLQLGINRNKSLKYFYDRYITTLITKNNTA